MAECLKCKAENLDGLAYCGNCADALEDTYGWLKQLWGPIAEKSNQIPAMDLLQLVLFYAFVVVVFPFAFIYRTRHYWPMWVALALFVVMQWNFPFIDWWKTWERQNSYYSHGPLVPLIAAFMVGANHKKLRFIKVLPSWLGLVLVLPSIPLFVFGRWTGSGNACAISFIAFLVGGVLMFTGTRVTRLLLFPMLYLLFMVPAPATVLDKVTMPVQLSSTILAAKILTYTGYDVVRGGTVITGADLPGPLRVAGECSGFRMLISLLTFTAFFVYMVRAPFWKKAFLVCLSFPLSLFVNGLRIAAIGYVGIWTESEQAMMNFHNSWAMVFELVVSFAILFGIAKLIKANDFGITESKVAPELAAQAERKPAYRIVGRGLRGPAMIAILCAMIFLNIAVKPLETTAKGQLVRANFPPTFASWISHDQKLDALTAEELKTADMLQRIYVNSNDDTQWVHVFIQAARDTDAFHDPHSCLPGGGSDITEDRPVTITFDKPRHFTVTATLLRFINDNTGDENLLLYWYNTGSDCYPATADVRLKMRQEQINDLKTMLLHPGQRAELERDYARSQTYCYRFTCAVDGDTAPALRGLESFIKEFVATSRQFDR